MPRATPIAEPGHARERVGRVAVVGAACRLPGVPGLHAFRALLAGGRAAGGPGPVAPAPDRAPAYDPAPEGCDVRADPVAGDLSCTVADAFENAGLPAEDVAGRRAVVYTTGHPRGTAGLISGRAGLTGVGDDLDAATDATDEPALTALHLASRDLRAGTADLAVLAGPGGPGAYGTAGTVAIVLRPLDAATDDGDHVYAVVAGSAIDGEHRRPGEHPAASTGSLACERSGLPRGAIASHDRGSPVPVGWTEILAAALRLDAGAADSVALALRPHEPDRAAVVLAAPLRAVPTSPPAGDPAVVLPLSASHPESLGRLAGAYAAALVDDDLAPADLAHSAATRRSHHPYRVAVTGAGRDALADGLRDAAAAEPPAAAVRDPRTVFVFPGQGAQWVGMGRTLLAADPVFGSTLRTCGDAVAAELGWSPVDRLLSDEPLTAVEEIQPTVWALQVALAAWWSDRGVEPDLVVGHSMGEIAAATVAGALGVEDAAAVVSRRAVLIGGLTAPGAMWTVGLDEAAAREAIGPYADRVCPGVLNSATSTVLSGDPDALKAIVAPLLERGVFCRRVKVSYASHAPQVEPLRPGLLAALADVSPAPLRVPMHSTVRDAPVDGPELDGAYWMDNLRGTVRFAAAVGTVLADPEPALFVEISPHPLLAPVVTTAITAAGAHAAAVTSLRRGRPDRESLLEGLGGAWAFGAGVDWSRALGGRFVPLPVAGREPVTT